MIVTSKYYWQTVFILTLVNPPPPLPPPSKNNNNKKKTSQVANEQKNKSVMRGNSGAGKVIRTKSAQGTRK